MKRVEKLSTYLKWNGELVEVIGIADGKVIVMRPVNAKPCEHCGQLKEYYSFEHSPQFQAQAKPVDTILQ